MATGTFTDEYGNTYNTPYIPSKIVGFSGIDPAPIAVATISNAASNNNSNGDGTIIEVDTIGNNGSSGSGGDGYAIDHEELDNLLGGEEYEHYHLSEKDYDDLVEFLGARRAAEEAGETSCSLTEEEYERIMQLLEDYYSGLEDGEEKTKHFLTDEEYEKLFAILEATYPDEENGEPIFPTSFDEEFFNELTNTRIEEYLNAHSAQYANADAETLNEAIDTRIESYLSSHTLRPANIDEDALNALIDARIASALSNKCGCCSNNNNNNNNNQNNSQSNNTQNGDGEPDDDF